LSIAKLRKHHLKSGNLREKDTALFLGLILDLKVKVKGLKALGLGMGFISDIKTKALKEEYNR
jgi:hypothetical protein